MWFIAGLMIGLLCGIGLAALLVSVAQSDECEECMRRQQTALASGLSAEDYSPRATRRS